MNAMSGGALVAVTGALVLFTSACGGAVSTDDLFREDDGATARSARAPEPATSSSSSSSTSASPPAATPEVNTESTATCAAPKRPASEGPTCSRKVTVASFQVARASCYVDTDIEQGAEGTLHVPCEGDGDATLIIGSMLFRGAVASGRIDVCAGTEFLWQDGCMWTSAQRVYGALSDDALVFSYGEAPKAGEAGCANACSASGSLRVR